MDEKSRQFFTALKQETAELWVRWKIYRAHYSDAPPALNVWNLNGTGMFAVLQTVLFEDMVLRLCKLTEPVSTYENLSIRKLCASLESVDPEFVRDRLNMKLAALLEKLEKLRMVRNRRIAHLGLDQALDIGGGEVPALTRNDIEQPIRMLSALLNVVEERYLNTKCFYDAIVVPLSDDGQQLSQLLVRVGLDGEPQ